MLRNASVLLSSGHRMPIVAWGTGTEWYAAKDERGDSVY